MDNNILAWLVDRFSVSGLSVGGLSLNSNPPPSGSSLYPWSDGYVRVDWLSPPTPDQQSLASGIIGSYSTLVDYQQQYAATLQVEMDEFVLNYYSPNTISLLNALYAQSIKLGFTNRANYLEPAINWGNQVAEAIEQAVESVYSATSISGVQAVALSFPIPSGNLPTRRQAMSITG